MLPINVLSPIQLKLQIAFQAKERRLACNLSRKTLASKSGVPASTIKRFEMTGDIGVDALLRIALVLDCLDVFSQLFAAKMPVSLDHIPAIRKRGRT
jgi:transcriptional regulator with XRE-family HTH domain